MQEDRDKYTMIYYFYCITVYDRNRILVFLNRSTSDATGGLFTAAYTVSTLVL